jgi:hypothetical protein
MDPASRPRRRHAASSFTAVLSTMVHRATNVKQMDFEFAATTISYLLWCPSKVYKLTQWRHEIKGQWTRDDPAFVLVMVAWIAVSFVAYGFALDGFQGLGTIVKHVGFGVLTFFVLGAAAAGLTSALANHYFVSFHPHSVPQRVEFLYAFDVHCNAFVAFFALVGVLQYLSLPLLLARGFFPAVAANSLYLAAGIAYINVTFLGFLALPFLNKDKVTALLYPAIALILLWTVACIMRVNAARFMLGFVF